MSIASKILTKTNRSMMMIHPTFNPIVRWDDPLVETFLSESLGTSRFQSITEALVTPPLTTCLRVNTLRTTPEDILDKLPQAVALEDQSFLTSTPTETKIRIHPQLPAILVSGNGPHHIDYSKTEGFEVVVGRKAGEAILRGSHCYAPGILATTNEINKDDLVAVSIGLEMPGVTTYGVKRGAVLPRHIPLDDPRFPNRKNLFIGIARAEVPRTGLCASKSGLALTMVKRIYNLPSFHSILPGECMLQNLPSLLAARVLDPIPGSRVLDMCAAPGGKTTALAEMMGDRGEIIALDRSHSKVLGINELAKKHGIQSIQAMRADSTKILLKLDTNNTLPESSSPPLLLKSEKQEEEKQEEEIALCASPIDNGPLQKNKNKKKKNSISGEEKVRLRQERKEALRRIHGNEDKNHQILALNCPGYPPESFDYILLDAPCTALGQRPRFLISTTLDELHGTAQYQRKLLSVAVQLLRPGGFLVFSTCSFSPLENERNVRYVVDSYPNMKLVPQMPYIGQHGLTGSLPGKDGTPRLLLSEDESKMVQRFDPGNELDTIGFFIAKFQKIE